MRRLLFAVLGLAILGLRLFRRRRVRPTAAPRSRLPRPIHRSCGCARLDLFLLVRYVCR